MQPQYCDSGLGLLGRFIVTPNVPEDVVKAVQFGATHRLKVAARGTGHQLAGLILPEGGITIDMRNMVHASFDSATNISTLQVRRSSGACTRCWKHDYQRITCMVA